MATEDAKLIVSLEARVDAFEKAFNRAGNIADSKFSAIERRTKQAGDRMREQMASSVESMNGVLGAIGIGLGLRELEEIIDTYTRLNTRIQSLSGSAEEGKAIMEELGRVAKQNSQDVDALTKAYADNSVALDDMKIGHQDQIKWLEVFAAEGKRSGKTIEEITAAYQSLVTQLDTGKPSVKIFKQLETENSQFLKDLAIAMLGPKASIKDLETAFLEGKAGPAEFNAAISKMRGGVQDEVQKMAKTINDEITAIKNAFKEYVNSVNNSTGVTKVLVTILQEVATHMDVVGPAITAAGGLLALNWTAKAVAATTATKGLAGAVTGLGLAYTALNGIIAIYNQQKEMGKNGMTWGDEWAVLKSGITGDDSDVIARIKAHRADGTMPDPGSAAEEGRQITIHAPPSTGSAMSPDISNNSNPDDGPNAEERQKWAEDLKAEQQKIDLLNAETAARRGVFGSLEEEEAFVKRAEVAQDLLNKAKAENIKLDDATLRSISQLADAYSKASIAAADLAKSQQEAEQRTKELESTGDGALHGFVHDLEHGKSAGEALYNALQKIADKLVDMELDNIWKAMMQNGGDGFFKGLSGVMAGPADKHVSLAPLTAHDVGKMAETAHMNVQAGTVSVNGGIGSDAVASKSGGDVQSTANLPDHPHTPTPSEFGKMPTMADFGGTVVTGGLPSASAFSGGQSTTARQAIEAYYGKPITDAEYKSLINATSAEASGGKGNPQEQAMITASILNRARTNKGGIEGALDAPNQFQAVTGTAANGHQPSQAFLDGPSAARLAQIEKGNVTYLPSVSRSQTDFTAASAAAYGPGTDIGYRDNMLANGGSVYGGSIFNTSLPNPNDQIAKIGPQLQTFTSGLQSANTGLSGLASTLAGSLGGGGLLKGIAGLAGFADGGLIDGTGTGTSDSNLARVSDGEFIVNSAAAGKNRALLEMINSGKAPRFAAGLNAVSHANHFAPTLNIDVTGDSADKMLATKIARASTKALSDQFRASQGQKAAAMAANVSKAERRNL